MIKFFNIRSGEERIAEIEPHISALWSSSDRSPNVNQGQDFGWRLAPETVVEAERIMQDPRMIETIAVTYGLIPDQVRETDVLTYISDQADRKAQGMEQTQEDFQAKYQEEIRRLKESGQASSGAAIVHDEPTKPTFAPTEPIAPEAAPAPSEALQDRVDQEMNDEENTDEAQEEVANENSDTEGSESDGDGPSSDGEGQSAEGDQDGSSEADADEQGPTAGESEQPEANEQEEPSSSAPAAQFQEVNANMSRAQLEAIAKGEGVEAPSSYPTPDALVEAIRQNRSAQ